MSADNIEKALFEDFSQDELKTLLGFSNAYSFSQGELLFEEGAVDDSVFIIREGEIELSATNSRGEEVSISVIGNGTVLGEIAFFDGRARTTSATALSALEVIVISKDSFNNMANEFPMLAIKVLQEFGRITAERLRWADEIIVEIIQSKN